MGKKQLQAAAWETSPSKRNKLELPSVAEMDVLSASGKLTAKPVLDERIHVSLVEYMKSGSLYGEVYTEKPVWLALMATGRQPNPLYQTMKQVELFGTTAINLFEM